MKMTHIAIMKKQWGMIPKILAGEKTIESRWYKTKRPPWNKIKKGEIVYFKNSGEPVTTRATVAKIFQFSDLTPKKVREILEKFGQEDGIAKEKISFYTKLFADKKYCLLIFLEKPKMVKPFQVSKKGFGAMAAWLTGPSLQLFRFSPEHP